MSKSIQKMEAINLRRKGMSIKHIADKLSVSKSSASLWCRDISLTQEQSCLIRDQMIQAGHKGRMLGALRNKEKKQDKINTSLKEGLNVFPSLTKREFLIAGISLYWAEGSKKNNKLVFTNSDPRVITFMYLWFKVCFDVKDSDFMPRIFIMESHRHRFDKVLSFWSNLLVLPPEQFGKPVFLKSDRKKLYENHDNYFGVMALGVSKGTDLKYRIIGLIEGLSNSNKPA